MNILVCVKQVPDTTEIRIDPEKHTLIRDGVPSIVNPFDGYALECAARIKDKDPSTKITVVSMNRVRFEATYTIMARLSGISALPCHYL